MLKELVIDIFLGQRFGVLLDNSIFSVLCLSYGLLFLPYCLWEINNECKLINKYEPI